jgi:hypothetical protein
MMKHLTAVFLCSLAVLPAQQRVDPRNTHQRLLCVVPLVGSGTNDDPRRPAHAPIYSKGAPRLPSGIIAYSYQVSDDGRYALVEFVARDRSAFQELLSSKSQAIKVFEKGKDRREDIEQEFRKYKKNIDLNLLGMVVP